MTAPSVPTQSRRDRGRRDVVVAALGVLLGAADTYVVVLVLPSVMTDIGLGLDELQRATPIVSGFLLGYIAVLPLVGRLSDLLGRPPVLVGCLVVFALGSGLTAAAPDLTTVVSGRLLQGLGAGGLVPVTLALVADRWPPGARGLPLGVVGAVQELGSVLGPLYGALAVSVSGWRVVFWANLVAGLLLAAALARAGRLRLDVVGGGLLALTAGCALLAVAEPARLADDVALGRLFLPLAGPAWTSPLWLAALALSVTLAGWSLRSGHGPRLVALRRLPALARRLDLLGSALLAAALGCVVVAFATADPERQVLSADGPLLLGGAAALAVGFVAREVVSRSPLVPLAAFGDRAAWGALVVSAAAGVALIAALVDIPFFARATRHPDSQVAAAFVLVRFLVALPVGAVLGGLLCRMLPWRAVASAGMGLAALAFLGMSRWDADALGSVSSGVVLFAGGLGFGLAVAPVNDALLAAVRSSLHGLAAALAVVARTTGMVVGISLLTAVGLRRFATARAAIPSPLVSCPAEPTRCPAYTEAVRAAVLDQLSVVFSGAAVAAGLAALAAAILLRRPPTSARGSAPA